MISDDNSNYAYSGSVLFDIFGSTIHFETEIDVHVTFPAGNQSKGLGLVLSEVETLALKTALYVCRLRNYACL